MVKVREDLTGKIFGRWLVIKQDEDYVNPNNGRRFAQWLCECSCEEHTRKIILQSNLKNGTTTSCGCFAREQSGKRMGQIAADLNKRYKHKTNTYNLDGEYGVGYTSNTNREFYFDLDDYDKIKDYCWCEHIIKDGYHALEAYDSEEQKNIRMHWLIVGKYYDHKNRNPLDNRKENLRYATQENNAKNSSLSKNNTSGYIGVNWLKKNNVWTASIGINSKLKYLGSFTNKDDAIKARLQAEAKYYDEFAPQKHLFEQYGISIKYMEDATK
jgi:hypothetical protein